MPVLNQIDIPRRRITSSWSGVISYYDIIGWIDWRMNEKCRDFDGLIGAATVYFDFKATEMSRVAAYLEAIANAGAMGRTAVVAADDLTFGIFRRLTSLAERSCTIRPCRNLAEAYEWLGWDGDPNAS